MPQASYTALRGMSRSQSCPLHGNHPGFHPPVANMKAVIGEPNWHYVLPGLGHRIHARVAPGKPVLPAGLGWRPLP
jgi:hypothetical protein